MTQSKMQISTTPPLSGLALVQQANAALQAVATQSSLQVKSEIDTHKSSGDHDDRYARQHEIATHKSSADHDTRYMQHSARGAVNGVAPLGADGLVPMGHIPALPMDKVPGVSEAISQGVAGPVAQLQGQINNKANGGAVVQWHSGVVEFGFVDTNATRGQAECPAPWVMVGIRNVSLNTFTMRAVQLRNQ
jgi:hypothetical protein